MYGLTIKPEADKIFRKLSKKNQAQLRIIHKKITEIQNEPHRDYKFLRKPMQHFNRVHIDTHFVLLFTLDHQHEIVEIWYFDHHDFVYEWRPGGKH